jgi:hypothetical protein
MVCLIPMKSWNFIFHVKAWAIKVSPPLKLWMKILVAFMCVSLGEMDAMDHSLIRTIFQE